MSTAALDKLYLSARNIGPLFRIKSPSRFLQLAPSPPLQAKLTDAIEYLPEVGALVNTGGQKTCELAEFTMLGRLAIDLPLSTCLSRLILIGYSVGMAYEAVTNSAYLTLDYDCFIMPTPFTT